MGACISGTRWTQAGLSQMFTSRTDSPKYTEAEQILCALCAISVERTVLICVHLWLKLNQSKITNYAKQTQFPKSQK
jgi:hypothetical protein